MLKNAHYSSDNLKEKIKAVLLSNTKEEVSDYLVGWEEIHIPTATDQILALIEGLVPPEKIKADATFNMMAEEVLIDDCLVDGYNKCRDEILDKIKEGK